jgi:hypothetical protein
MFVLIDGNIQFYMVLFQDKPSFFSIDVTVSGAGQKPWRVGSPERNIHRHQSYRRNVTEPLTKRLYNDGRQSNRMTSPVTGLQAKTSVICLPRLSITIAPKG